MAASHDHFLARSGPAGDYLGRVSREGAPTHGHGSELLQGTANHHPLVIARCRPQVRSAGPAMSMQSMPCRSRPALTDAMAGTDLQQASPSGAEGWLEEAIRTVMYRLE
jgi:hypothetical protein